MKKLILIFALIISLAGYTQNHSEHETDKNHSFRHFKIALAFAQSYIPSYHYHEETESSQLIPTNGIEIQYNFTHKFFAKWTNEIEFLSYTLKDEDGEKQIRDNAFLSIVTFGYDVIDKLAIIAGAGYEIEKSKNLWVCRFGMEYTIPFAKNWELSPEILYDIKKDSHTAITWGVGFGYRF